MAMNEEEAKREIESLKRQAKDRAARDGDIGEDVSPETRAELAKLRADKAKAQFWEKLKSRDPLGFMIGTVAVGVGQKIGGMLGFGQSSPTPAAAGQPAQPGGNAPSPTPTPPPMAPGTTPTPAPAASQNPVPTASPAPAPPMTPAAQAPPPVPAPTASQNPSPSMPSAPPASSPQQIPGQQDDDYDDYLHRVLLADGERYRAGKPPGTLLVPPPSAPTLPLTGAMAAARNSSPGSVPAPSTGAAAAENAPLGGLPNALPGLSPASGVAAAPMGSRPGSSSSGDTKELAEKMDKLIDAVKANTDELKKAKGNSGGDDRQAGGLVTMLKLDSLPKRWPHNG